MAAKARTEIRVGDEVVSSGGVKGLAQGIGRHPITRAKGALFIDTSFGANPNEDTLVAVSYEKAKRILPQV